MKLGTIEEELAACRKACKGVKIGDPIKAKCKSLAVDYWNRGELLNAECWAKRKPLYAELTRLHRKTYPDTTWNGQTIAVTRYEDI